MESESSGVSRLWILETNEPTADSDVLRYRVGEVMGAALVQNIVVQCELMANKKTTNSDKPVAASSAAASKPVAAGASAGRPPGREAEEKKEKENMVCCVSWDPTALFVVGKGFVLESTPDLRKIMDAANPFQTRLLASYEGSEYQLGDFRIRVMLVRHGQKLQNQCAIEICYWPVSTIKEASSILEEMMTTVSTAQRLSREARISPSYNLYKLDVDRFSPAHLALQYAVSVMP